MFTQMEPQKATRPIWALAKGFSVRVFQRVSFCVSRVSSVRDSLELSTGCLQSAAT